MPAKKTDIEKEAKKETKKKTTKKTVAKKATAKTASKKVTTKKASSRKNATKTAKKTVEKKPKATAKNKFIKDFNISEYYDLPEKYEKTIVKILAQTPDTLFVYWDISEEDRKNYVSKYGPSFFYDTKPVLIVTNKTMNYTFEIDINDFANCWYLHVNNSKCEYSIELGRRPINNNIEVPNDYIYISSSNTIEAPNDHILFETEQSRVYFKNVKTNVISSKPIINFNFLRNIGKYYNIYEFYENTYKDDFTTASKLMGNSSSVFK